MYAPTAIEIEPAIIWAIPVTIIILPAAVAPKTPVTIALKSRDAKELRDTRYAPHDARINTTTFIYGKKVAIVSLNKQLPTAVVIDDADIRDTLDHAIDAVLG